MGMVSIDDVFCTNLFALTEHSLDSELLRIARVLRVQASSLGVRPGTKRTPTATLCSR